MKNTVLISVSFLILTITSCDFNPYGQPGSLHYTPKIKLDFQDLDLKQFQDSLILHADSCTYLDIAKQELEKLSSSRFLIYYNSDPRGYAVIQDASSGKKNEFYVHLRRQRDEDGYFVETGADEMNLKELQKRLNSLLDK